MLYFSCQRVLTNAENTRQKTFIELFHSLHNQFKKTSTAHALKVVSLLSPMPLRQEEHQENVPFYN